MRHLALYLLPLAGLAAEERSCTLKFAWWDAPRTTPQPVLALACETEPKPFSPQVMNFTTEARNIGDAAHLLVRQMTKDPKTGKETVEWVPFGDVALPPGDNTLGVVLITDDSGKRGAGRAFPLGSGNFPLGSIRLVNLTNQDVLLGLGGRALRIPAGAAATHPKVFGKPEIAEISVMAALSDKTVPVFSTKSEFSSLYRLVLFVAEIPNTEPPRFEVRTVVDFPQPEPKPAGKPSEPGASAAPEPKPATGQPDKRGESHPAPVR